MKVRIGQQIACLRCGKAWHARKTEVRMCPRCKTPYFNVLPKKREAVA
jgi:Zn finger protein HypA/HybF involved in hydrogenase expression